jgi:hypothetical protein
LGRRGFPAIDCRRLAGVDLEWIGVEVVWVGVGIGRVGVAVVTGRVVAVAIAVGIALVAVGIARRGVGIVLVAVGIGRVAGVAVVIGRAAVVIGWIGIGGMEQQAGAEIGRMKLKQGVVPGAGATKTPIGSCLILLHLDRAPEEHTHGVSCGGA